MRFLLALTLAFAAAFPLPTTAQQPEPMTLKQIMADPDWLGTPPRDAYWAEDGSAVYFRSEGKLLVAPYAVRPLPGAPVSAPLRWHEVEPGLDIRRFTIRSMPRRARSLNHTIAAVGLIATALGNRGISILHASATLANPAREAWIGWDRHGKAQRLHLVVTNVRFLVLPGQRVLHLASRVLAANLRNLAGVLNAVADQKRQTEGAA